MYYALFAGVFGVAASAVLSLTLVRVMAEAMWYMQYEFTVVLAMVTSVICLLLAVCISMMTDKVWNKGSIVEQLREAIADGVDVFGYAWWAPLTWFPPAPRKSLSATA